MKRIGIVCALFLVGAAQALSAPPTSLRPVARTQVEPIAHPVKPVPQVRPVARTDILIEDIRAGVSKHWTVAHDPIVVQAGAAIAGVTGLTTSLRPVARSGSFVDKVMGRRQARKRGSVCGDADIKGEEVGFVPGKLKGCGIPEAVRVTVVDGVRLSQPALMRCSAAKALKTWVRKGAKRAVGTRGGGLAEMRVAAHYSCRTRNHQPGAPLSEHSTGRAIDFSAFILKNGDRITVLEDWGNGRDGRILKKMHKEACGPFGTVLGPNSDRFHRDHFHFDTARHGNGPYCR